MSVKKVIIIEDDKMLSTVFKMFLTEIGHELLGFYINPYEAFKKIEEEKPDVVLMDIFLPGDMDGIKASNHIQDFYNIPVIYLSSSTDEETIQRALQSHISGYLLKPIDKTALRINIELACSKFDYFESIRYHSNISKFTHSGIATISNSGTLKWCNNSFKLLFNLSEKIDLDRLFSSLGYNLFNEITNDILASGFHESIINIKNSETNKLETFIITGSYIESNDKDIIINVSKIPFEYNKNDSTSELLASYNTLLRSSSEAIFYVNKNNILYDLNSHAERYCNKLFGVRNPKNKSIFNIFNFFNKSEFNTLIENVFDGISHYLERRVETEGKVLFLKLNLSPIFVEDKVVNYCILMSDITHVKTIEQKYADLKSELKPIFESSIQRFYLIDQNFEVVSFNKAASDVIKGEFNTLIKKGDNIVKYIPPELDLNEFKSNFAKALRGEHLVFKERLRQPNGNFIWNESHLDPIINEKGEIYRILLWTLDITESEKNLIELEKSQERYELVAKGGNDGIWDWDMENNEIYISPRWKAVLGYEDFEIENKFGTRDSLIHPEDLIESDKTLKKYLAGETDVFENEIRLKHKDGEYKWILERGITLKDKNGKPYRMAGSITDITDRKLMIDKLSDINKSLLAERSLFNKGNIGVIKADYNDLTIKYVSSNINYVLGYTENDFISGGIDIDSLIIEDDRDLHRKERREALDNNADFIEYTDYRILKKDGNLVWIRDFTIITKDSDNNSTLLLGYYIDVTEYKELENKLIENEKKFSKLFDYANDAIIIVDETKVIDVNKAAINLFGYSEDEFINLDVDKILPEKQPSGTDTTEKRNRKLHEAREGNSEPFYWMYKNKKGEVFESEVSTTHISINGKTFYHSLIRDITYRKQIEKSLNENKQKNESILNAIPDMVLIFDEKGICKYFKPDFNKTFDFDSKVVIGKGVEFFFTDVKKDTIIAKIQESLNKNDVITYKFKTSTPIGKTYFEVRISPLSKTEAIAIVRNIKENEILEN